jgi:hypothetical protein
MMLYAPLVTCLVAYRVSLLPAALLILVMTSVFFAQNALGLQLRGRGGPGNTRWLAAFAAAGSAAGVGLLVGHDLLLLLPLGVPAALLFAWQAWQRRQTRRQIDHSTINELATVAVMALGATAAFLASDHGWMPAAALPWAAFTLYFCGSVLYVKMRVRNARAGDNSDRWRQGMACGLFHIVLGVLIVGLATGEWPGLHFTVLGGVAAAPAIIRACIAWYRLDGSLPSLRRIGVVEAAFSTWFSVWIGVALADV